MPKGKDPLKPSSLEFQKRQNRWRHNGFFGACVMAKANMQAIAQARTATGRAKAWAIDIEAMLELLEQELKTRIDQ